MRTIAYSLTLSLSLFCSAVASAQFAVTWPLTQKPSDERSLATKNDVKRMWLCYSLRTGRLSPDCPITLRMTGIGGPGVTDACMPDGNGGFVPLSCGNGGHTHDETDRPLIFPNTEVEYPPAMPDNDPLYVEGPSPSSFSDIASWGVSQFGGIYTFTSTMTAPMGSSFWTFSNGVLTKRPVLTAEGRVNVTVDGDTLRELPDLPQIYEKGRNQNATAVTHTDEVAFMTTLKARTALAAIGRSFSNRTQALISYNDASLPKGGVFDLLAVHPLGGTDRPWQPPHSSHRGGLDIDVNHPIGGDCVTTTTVQDSVDDVLAKDTDPRRLGRSALICETNNNNNYHIRTTELLVPEAFIILFGL